MGNFAENLNLGNRVRPPWIALKIQFKDISKMNDYVIIRQFSLWSNNKRFVYLFIFEVPNPIYFTTLLKPYTCDQAVSFLFSPDQSFSLPEIPGPSPTRAVETFFLIIIHDCVSIHQILMHPIVQPLWNSTKQVLVVYS